MTEVDNLIYQFDNTEREIIRLFHQMLTVDYLLTAKITFKNPSYCKHNWICYLKALKNDKFKLAFMRGNEMSNSQGTFKKQRTETT
jgi:hypothetical protein